MWENMEKAKKYRLAKENEIRNEVKKNREKFMLEKAKEMTRNEGIQALNLPQLAKISGYSKPTIYKYFPKKEDLMVALAIESTTERISYYERALRFEGRAREKIMALHSLNFGILNDDFHDWLSILIDKVHTKATHQRQEKLNQNNERILEIHAEIVRQAISDKDLVLAEGMDEYKLVFTLTATTIGGYVMTESDSPIINKWFKRIKFMHGTFGQIVLDGMGWRPLSSDWDYTETLKRLYKDVFPELSTA